MHFAVFCFVQVLNVFATLRSPSLSALMLAFAVLLLIPLTIWVILRRLRVQPDRISIVASLAVALVVYYSNAQDLAGLAWTPFLKTRWFLPAYTMLLVLLTYWALTRAKSPGSVNIFLSLVALGFLVQALIAAGPNLFKTLEPPLLLAAELNPADPRRARLEHGPLSLEKVNGRYPDIYYIVLDSYTSGPSLRRYWSYDNAPFLDSLRALGFYVADSSRATGTATASCIATYLGTGVLDDQEPLRQQIRESVLVSRLQREGFQLYNLSLFDIGSTPRFYNKEFYEEGNASDFSLLVEQTGLIRLAVLKSDGDGSSEPFAIMDSVARLAASPSAAPRFIYAHLLLPHPPYFLDSTGAVKPASRQADGRDPAGYLEQLKGTNRLLLPLLHTILNYADRPPVIVMQGDHGSRLLKGAAGADESTTILNAYFAGTRGFRGLSQTISPASSFELLLWD